MSDDHYTLMDVMFWGQTAKLINRRMMHQNNNVWNGITPWQDVHLFFFEPQDFIVAMTCRPQGGSVRQVWASCPETIKISFL